MQYHTITCLISFQYVHRHNPVQRRFHPTSFSYYSSRNQIGALSAGRLCGALLFIRFSPIYRKVYSAAITRYTKFCNQFLLNTYPTSEQTLCKFVTYLAMDHISASSLNVYLAAVCQLHLQQGLPPPTVGDMPRLQQVLRGIKQAQARSPNPTSSQRSRLPITPTLLHTIWYSWSDRPLDQDSVMLWVAFTTCFFGFMRSGELCIHDTSKGFDETIDLTCEDVAADNYQNPSLICIHLKSSKTDPFCKGTDILLARTRDELCPVAAMLQWLVQRGNTPGPLCYFTSGTPLTRPRLVTSL